MLWGRIQWPFLNSGIILNHLAISFSSELILHLHGSGDGGGGVYGGGMGGFFPTVIYNCYYNSYIPVI